MPLARTKPWLTAGLRSDALVASILLAVCGVLWLPRLQGPLDLRWDAGAYYTLSTSLAEGRGYRLLNEPGHIEAIQYPPLLSGIGAAYQLALGSNDPILIGRWLRPTFAVIFTAYILIVYFLLKSDVPRGYALLATLIAAVSPATIVISDFFLSDIPFACVAAGFVLLNRSNNAWVARVVLPLIAILAYALRTMGVALLASWVAESVLNRRPKQALFRVIVSALPVLGWHCYAQHVQSHPEFAHPFYPYQRADYMYYNVSYAQNISLVEPFAPDQGHLTAATLANRVLHNAARMPRTLGDAVAARLDYWKVPFRVLDERSLAARALSWFLYLAPLGLGGLILGGIVLQLMRRRWLIPSYLVFTITLICLTPFRDMFLRYMIPLTPFLALSLFEMVIWLKQRMERMRGLPWRVIRLGSVTLVICLCLLQAPFYLYKLYTTDRQHVVYDDRNGRTITYRLFHYDETCRSLDQGIDWLNSHAKQDDIVAVSMPHYVHLRTGLTTVMPPFERDPVTVENLLNSVPASLVILDSTLKGNPADTTPYVAPVVHNAPQRWKRVYAAKQGGCEIYRRVEGAEQ